MMVVAWCFLLVRLLIVDLWLLERLLIVDLWLFVHLLIVDLWLFECLLIVDLWLCVHLQLLADVDSIVDHQLSVHQAKGKC